MIVCLSNNTNVLTTSKMILSSLYKKGNVYYFDFLRPTTRYGQQNDIREQNRALTTTNEDLQRQLEEMKVIILIIDLVFCPNALKTN